MQDSTINLFIWLPIAQYSAEVLVFLAITAWAVITKRANIVSNIFLALITSSAIIQVAYYFTWNLTFVSLLLNVYNVFSICRTVRVPIQHTLTPHWRTMSTCKSLAIFFSWQPMDGSHTFSTKPQQRQHLNSKTLERLDSNLRKN